MPQRCFAAAGHYEGLGVARVVYAVPLAPDASVDAQGYSVPLDTGDGIAAGVYAQPASMGVPAANAPHYSRALDTADGDVYSEA